MTLLLFALSRYLVVLLLCASAYFIGSAFLQRLTFATLAERLSLCVAFGLGVLSHLMLLIGLFGWLTYAGVLLTILTTTAVSIVICLRHKIADKPTDRGVRPTRLRWLIGALIALAIAVVVLPILVLPLYPPTDFDATMYHLATAKTWLQASAVVPTPFLRGSVWPHSAHTLFATLLIVKDDLAAQILSLVATGLVGIGLFGWGKRIHGTGAGILAAALWIGSPAVLVLTGVASYHLLASLFAFASIYALATYARTRHVTWLFAAGAFVGFAQSTWPGTISFVPLFAGAATYFAIRERRPHPLYAVAAGILIGWGPSLIREMWYTGNPTFPLLTEIFGTGPWWTREDVAKLAADIQQYGLPRTVLNFLSIPYALLVQPRKFQGFESFSIILSIALPLVVIRSIRDTGVRWLALAVLFYAACWFVFGQIMRYLLPIAPVLCVITAISIAGLADGIGRRWRTLSVALMVLVTAGAFLPGLIYVRKEVGSRGPVPVTPEARDVYIGAQIPQYAALKVANATPGPVYSLLGTRGAYYSDGPFMGDFFGPGRYSEVFDSLSSGDALYATLHRLGAKYLLVSLIDFPGLLMPNDRAFDGHFEPLFANDATELYLIHDVPRPILTNRANLLRNAGFDEVENAWPVAWGRYGNPIVGAPSMGATSGDVAVEVTGSDGLDQSVRITSGGIYELAMQARADKSGSVFRLQVNWINREGNICKVFIRVCEATVVWKGYSCRVTAPPCAAIAHVYAIGQSPEKVWLDSYVFTQKQTVSNKESSQP